MESMQQVLGVRKTDVTHPLILHEGKPRPREDRMFFLSPPARQEFSQHWTPCELTAW